MRLKRALYWSVFWILSALLFSLGLYFWEGLPSTELFLSGYLMEKALSVDNLLVFTAIFSYFSIPDCDKPKILAWGFLGALVFRAIFLLIGVGLLSLSPIIGVVFGVVVLWTAWKMMFIGEEDSQEDYEARWFVKLARRFSSTPWWIAMVAIEISDILFSFDSMPVVVSLVKDPFLIYTSVIFAVLGLRSLYFVLDSILPYFKYLSWGVMATLLYVGSRLVIHSLSEMSPRIFDLLNFSPMVNLGIILGLIGSSVLASINVPVSSPKSG